MSANRDINDALELQQQSAMPPSYSDIERPPPAYTSRRPSNEPPPYTRYSRYYQQFSITHLEDSEEQYMTISQSMATELGQDRRSSATFRSAVEERARRWGLKCMAFFLIFMLGAAVVSGMVSPLGKHDYS